MPNPKGRKPLPKPDKKVQILAGYAKAKYKKHLEKHLKSLLEIEVNKLENSSKC